MMNAEWIYSSAAVIAAVCAVIAAVECTIEEESPENGLRLICGAVAASVILRMLTAFLQGFF